MKVAGRHQASGSTVTAVNFPEVSLPPHPGKHRLLHVHRNRPGMLSRVNDAFSRRGVNVAAEYLRTAGDVGYVVVDVHESADTAALRDELAAIEGTIRCRMLY